MNSNPASDFTYSVSDGEVTILRYIGGNCKPSFICGKDGDAAETIVVIPDTIDGLPVRTVDRGAFREMDLIAEVVIPDTVRVIGYNVFNNCLNLPRLTLGSAVEEIYEAALYNCKELRALHIPRSVRFIGHHNLRAFLPTPR